MVANAHTIDGNGKHKIPSKRNGAADNFRKAAIRNVLSAVDSFCAATPELRYWVAAGDFNSTLPLANSVWMDFMRGSGALKCSPMLRRDYIFSNATLTSHPEWSNQDARIGPPHSEDHIAVLARMRLESPDSAATPVAGDAGDAGDGDDDDDDADDDDGVGQGVVRADTPEERDILDAAAQHAANHVAQQNHMARAEQAQQEKEDRLQELICQEEAHLREMLRGGELPPEEEANLREQFEAGLCARRRRCHRTT